MPDVRPPGRHVAPTNPVLAGVRLVRDAVQARPPRHLAPPARVAEVLGPIRHAADTRPMPVAAHLVTTVRAGAR